MPDHDTIAAFLDNEPFDPRALVDALAESTGRELLIELIALRTLAQPDETIVIKAGMGKRMPLLVRLSLAAAVLIAAVVGGYQLGTRSGMDASSPPAPTHVVKASAWQDVSGESVR